MTTLEQISTQLLKAAADYTAFLPKFYVVELRYTSVKAKLMRETSTQFVSQPLRDAAVQGLLEQTEEYLEYHKLFPEKLILDMQIKIYQQLSKNTIAAQWGTQ